MHPAGSIRRVRCLAAAVAMIAAPAHAWIYPEHRDIAVQAVQTLDPEARLTFERLWRDARHGDEARLCEQSADAAQGVAPPCLDWAALPALAGDHSCSPLRLLQVLRESDRALVIADIGAQLKEDLARIGSAPSRDAAPSGALADARRRLEDEAVRARITNALRTADTRLQRADPRYASRADANLAHFMVPRADTRLDPIDYATHVVRPGAPLNAGGLYVWYHLSALQKADRLSAPGLSDDAQRRLARAVLVDEAFALHFLQDMFAAGHVAGSWGDVSQRKGTHDYYNENGLEVLTWRRHDRTVVLMGDARMQQADAALAAEAVRNSLGQVIDVATRQRRLHEVPHFGGAGDAVDSFDVCTETVFPEHDLRFGVQLPRYREVLAEVLLDTPIPGLGPGPGAQPRSRSELGAFVGLVGGLDTRRVSGGFDPSQQARGSITGVNIGLRVGLGLEGALGESGDGLAFAQIGLQADGNSSNKILESGVTNGILGAAIPARTGLSLRLRAPYWLVPGDLLLLSPMYLVDRERFLGLAATASNGGLLGLQQGIATPLGRLQFVLGREIGLTYYGQRGDQQLIVPPTADFPGGGLVRFRSLSIDLPIVEFRPFRSFSADQSSSLLFQLYAGLDRPFAVSVENPPGAVFAPLRSVRHFGLRMVFEWRHYR